MIYIGMDLSGPSNIKDTAIAVFEEDAHNELICIRAVTGIDDIDVMNLINELKVKDSLAAGLDSPLSYNNRGGDRPGDTELRKKLTKAGMLSGSVMVPTFNRMVYLTLRGISIARMLKQICPGIKIAEIHPGGAMVLRGAPVEDVKGIKSSMDSRINLLNWLDGQGLKNFPKEKPIDHFVAACACALGVWKWTKNEAIWIHPAEAPIHPFDYVC